MPKPLPTEEQVQFAMTDLMQRFSSVSEDFQVLKILRVGSGSRPHVAKVRFRGKICVLKDHQGCDPWFARLLGPLLARREIRALRILKFVSGVPDLVFISNKRAFFMAWVEAKPYRQASLDATGWENFFRELERLVNSIHALGVAHGDMRSPDNTLLDTEGSPVLVDFVGSCLRGSRWNLWSHWLFSRLCEVDQSAIIKQKLQVAPELLSSAELAVKSEYGLVGRIGRGFGQFVRTLTRLMFTQKK